MGLWFPLPMAGIAKYFIPFFAAQANKPRKNAFLISISIPHAVTTATGVGGGWE